MINSKRISVILPCRNEEKALPGILARLKKVADEIIVVDNGSRDNTYEVARAAGVVAVKENRKTQSGIGYGFAHQTGIKLATGDYLVAMDGDGTYPIEQIEAAVNSLDRRRLDFVSCNRYPLKREYAVSAMRQIGTKILNLEVLILYFYPIKDILSGMWVVRRPVAQNMKFHSGGWNFSPEIKLQAIVNPYIRFGEYHIDHKVRQGESHQQLWRTGTEHAFYILFRRFTYDNPIYLLYNYFTEICALGLFFLKERRWPDWLGKDKKSCC